MSIIIARTTIHRQKFSKLFSTSTDIFDVPDLSHKVNFCPFYKLEAEEWFVIKNLDISKFKNDYVSEMSTTSYPQLKGDQLEKIKYICVKQGQKIFFQDKHKTNLASCSLFFKSLTQPALNSNPHYVIRSGIDAVYDIDNNELIFRNFSKIKKFFDNIDDIFKAATEKDVEDFVNESFLKIDESFELSKVGHRNRKRISALKDYFKDSPAEQIEKTVKYINEYNQDIAFTDEQFEISDDRTLERILMGLQELYYTTPFTERKRLANSIKDI